MSSTTRSRCIAAIAAIGVVGVIATPAEARKAPVPHERTSHVTFKSSKHGAAKFKASVAKSNAKVGARIANATTSNGICTSGFLGRNEDLGNPVLADYESPQRGTPRAQVNWITVARVGSGKTIYNTITPSWSVTQYGGGKTYCMVKSHWDHTQLGSGEDYAVISYVVYWNYLGGSTYQPVAYGSYNGISYWRADVNGAVAQFNVPMPPDGHPSNWTARTP